MCLAVPVRVIELIDDSRVRVELKGAKFDVCSSLMPDISVGDHVLVHAGFIIEKVSEKDAKTNNDLWNEIKKNG